MTILEQCTIGKAGQEKCEDAVVVNDRFAAVIDGSTSKSHQRFNPDMSNGRLCMTLVRQLLNTMPADTPSERFCQDITANVRAVYLQAAADMEQLTNHPTERMAASAAIYSPARREVWLVGDCQCLVDEQFYDNPKPYEEPVAEILGTYYVRTGSYHEYQLTADTAVSATKVYYAQGAYTVVTSPSDAYIGTYAERTARYAAGLVGDAGTHHETAPF